MTLTVGTNSYLSVADADSYWSARNNSTWSGASTAAKEKALIEATQYIDGSYDFVGVMTDLDQTLAWPRAGAYITSGPFKGRSYDSDEIPQCVKDACAELAFQALSTNLVTVNDRGGAIKRQKVDVIEIEYADNAPTQKSYDFVDMIIKPVLGGAGSSNVSLTRA